MRANRPHLVFLAALVLAASSSDARADETHECVVASTKAQLLRDDRKLVEAAAGFAICARAVCPGPVRRACLRWSAEVSAAVPTIVLAAHDAAGHDLLEVRVRLDGTLVAERLDGSPITEDPGPHVLRFEPPDGVAVEENVIVHEGEHNRLITVVLGATAAPSSSAPTIASSRVSPPPPDAAVRMGRPLLPTVSWVLGGVGVAGLGAFAYFGVTGQAERNNLQGTCARTRTCNPSQVTSMRTDLLAADVSLGVGVVALATATCFALFRSSARPPVIAIEPARGGTLAVWRGTF